MKLFVFVLALSYLSSAHSSENRSPFSEMRAKVSPPTGDQQSSREAIRLTDLHLSNDGADRLVAIELADERIFQNVVNNKSARFEFEDSVCSRFYPGYVATEETKWEEFRPHVFDLNQATLPRLEVRGFPRDPFVLHTYAFNDGNFTFIRKDEDLVLPHVSAMGPTPFLIISILREVTCGRPVPAR